MNEMRIAEYTSNNLGTRMIGLKTNKTDMLKGNVFYFSVLKYLMNKQYLNILSQHTKDLNYYLD